MDPPKGTITEPPDIVPVVPAPLPKPLKVTTMAGPGPVTLKVAGAAMLKPTFAPPTVNVPKAVPAPDGATLEADLTPVVLIAMVPAVADGANVPKLSVAPVVMVIGVITVALALPVAVAAKAAVDNELKATTTVAKRAKRFEDFMISPGCVKLKRKNL